MAKNNPTLRFYQPAFTALSTDRATRLEMDQYLVHNVAANHHPADPMHVSVTEAKAQLTELVRRAEAGDEVVLTRHGHPAVRLVPVARHLDRTGRLALLEALRAAGTAKAAPGPCAARSQDFLYGDDGLPE
jgi:prevent-host-death family protein